MTRICCVTAFLTAFAATAAGQTSTYPSDKILSFEIHGIHGLMTPEEARSVLRQAGFTEGRGGGEDWGKRPVTSFTRDETTIALGHYEGRITGISETRISRGELFDYADDLRRIKAHFELPDEDGNCIERDYGTRCGISDGSREGARFSASLTPQMIFLQVGRGE